MALYTSELKVESCVNFSNNTPEKPVLTHYLISKMYIYIDERRAGEKLFAVCTECNIVIIIIIIIIIKIINIIIIIIIIIIMHALIFGNYGIMSFEGK